MVKLKFSGHESFICKQFWIPKGLDFIWEDGGDFNAKDAVVRLGVGKNMVGSIRFWLRAFGMVDAEGKPVELANRLFGENGWDTYLEDQATVWLLHYHLVKTGYASVFNLVFNEFQIGRTHFTRQHLEKYLQRICDEVGNKTNKNTLERDVSAFFRSYLKPEIGKKSDIEDEFTRLMIDLGLIQSQIIEDASGNKAIWYSISKDTRDELPWQVVLYSILDQMGTEDRSVSFDQVYKQPNSAGLLFALSEEGLKNKIEQMVEALPEVIYSETAGNRVIQLTKGVDKYGILDGYYND